LPRLLVILRMSRDLVVQTAVELAEGRGRHWGLSLSLLLTRVLPAMDRLTDALAQGYWAAILSREGEARARYEHVVVHAADGVYDVDLDGRIRFANPALAAIVGRSGEELIGVPLSDVLHPVDPGTTVEALFNPDASEGRLTVAIVRPDGAERVLGIQTLPRRSDAEVVGFQGIVRDETGPGS
jgi:PAS domain S-box-containing protein